MYSSIDKRKAQDRLDELHTLVQKKLKDNTITNRFMDQVEAESEGLLKTIKTCEKAQSMSHMADMYPSTPTATIRKGQRWSAPSPLQASEAQYKGLYEAARTGSPYRLEIAAKGIPTWDGVSTKTALTESSFGGLPPIINPQAFGLLYEPTRLFDYIPVAAMPGPSVEYLQHESNTNPAAVVGEGQTKPDLGLVLTAKTASAVKIAALASVSMEALQDFGSFMSFVPTEVTRAVADAEADEVINGTGSDGHMRGILHFSGLQTRSVGTDTPLDAVQKAFNDLRTGSSFATPDLVITSPDVLSYLRRQKDDLHRYLLSPDPSTDQVDSLWGVPVVATTKCPAGKLIALDTTKAVQGWVRMGLVIETNRYGTEEWTKNLISFRAEERIGLGVTRPTAICVVDGLTEAGS